MRVCTRSATYLLQLKFPIERWTLTGLRLGEVEAFLLEKLNRRLAKRRR